MSGSGEAIVPAERPGALVVGASSGIGAALGRRLAHEGYAVALIARRSEQIEELARTINAEAGASANSPVARAYAHDVRSFEDAPALFERILEDFRAGGLELVVYAAGIMPEPSGDGWTFEDERAMMEINVLGAMHWLGLAAGAFRQAGRGVLVGVSSVAGDRGRRGNSAYQASKAALSTYLESLRYRLKGTGVRVVTVKPGYVATAMTAGMRLPRPAVISPERAAEGIVRASRGGAQVVYLPAYWAPIMWVVRHLPAPLMTRLPL